MNKRVLQLIFVLGLIAAAVGLLLNCTGGSSKSTCARYCRQLLECEGGDGYYYYDYYDGDGSGVLQHIQCVDGCNELRDDNDDLYECITDCLQENDCDDFSQCQWECYWDPYYYYDW